MGTTETQIITDLQSAQPAARRQTKQIRMDLRLEKKTPPNGRKTRKLRRSQESH